MATPLFANQEATIRHYLEHPRALDWSDPGTGKTRSVLEAFKLKRKEVGSKARMLVVAPLSTMDAAWGADCRKFTPGLKMALATAGKREAAFESEADIVVINTDGVKWLAQHMEYLRGFAFLAIDEVTYFKHHTSARSKALGKVAKHFNHRWALTGSPSTNVITDVWHQVFVIDGGRRLGQNFYHFRNTTCSPVQVGPSAAHIRWVQKQGVEAVVSDLVKDITVRFLFEECHDIPENFVTDRRITLSPAHRRAYDELKKRTILLLDSGQLVNPVNGAAVFTKLMQVASGAVYTDDGSYGVVDQRRAELIIELVQERTHSVVFYLWDHQLAELEWMAKHHGIKYEVINGSVSQKRRSEIIQAYQAGEYQTLFLHPQSAAHGITLTRGHTTIWASPTHNLEWWVQGNRRIYRAGQTKRTETIVIIASGTVEPRVFEACQAKNVNMQSLLKEVKYGNDL